MEVLTILLVVLVIVVVVGHGIWVFFAWLLRGCKPRNRLRFEPTLSDDRAATSRYLEHLRTQGVLDHQAHATLMRLLADEAKSKAYSGLFKPPPRASEPVAPPVAEPALPPVQTWAEVPVREEPIERPVRVAPPTAPPVDAREPAPLASPLPVAAPADTAAAARQPRRPVGEVLASFMAEKNIRWGELIGGLLILCCSTALVISLWSHIEAIPTLKFLIFTAVTAALFGVGLFVHHRWKLPTTGHAVLIISSLLVPLNFLAFAALSVRGAAVSPWTLGIEVATLLVFGWLALLAGRVLLTNAAGLFAGGIVGLSACSLVVRSLSPLTERELVGVAVLAVGLYAVVVAMHLWRHRRSDSLDEAETRGLFLQLGVQTFACLVPLGLMIFTSGQLAAMRLLSPLVCAVAAPGLVTGCFLARRVDRKAPGHVHTIALSIALVAAVVMLLGVGLAWPMPVRLMAALLVNALAVVALGRVVPHPAFHGLTAAWLAAGWVLVVHVAGGAVSWSTSGAEEVIAALLSVRTGQALLVPFVISLAIAEWSSRGRFRHAALGCGAAALVFAVISIGLISAYGFGRLAHAQSVVWIYLLYAAASFWLAWRWRDSRPTLMADPSAPLPSRYGAWRLGDTRLTWVGCVLLQAAIVQALICAWPEEAWPWTTALLVGGSLCTAAVVLIHAVRMRPEVLRVYAAPLASFVVVISLVAAALMALAAPAASAGTLAPRLAWLAGLWMVLAATRCWPVLFAGSQIALLLAAGAVVQHHLHGQSWYASLASPLAHPWVWQVHLLVAAGLCLVWAVCRLAVTHRRAGVSGEAVGNPHPQDATPLHQQVNSVLQQQPDSLRHQQVASVRQACLRRARELLDPRFPAADRGIAALTLVGLMILAAWSVWPATVAEHGWVARPTLPDLHTHAAGLGAWLVLAILAVGLGVHLRQGYHVSAVLGLLLTVGAGVALAAARFEPQQQVVEAWRWLSASVFLVGSTVFCLVLGSRRLAGEPNGLVAEADPSRGDGLTAAEPSLQTKAQARCLAARLALGRQPRERLSAESVGLWLFLVFFIPVLLLTASFISAVGSGDALPGATVDAFWLRLSLLGPALLAVVTLLGYAFTQKHEGYAVAAAILSCAVVAATELSIAARTGVGWSPEFIVWLVQLGAIVSAAIPAGWGAARLVLGLREDGLIYPRWPMLLARAALGIVLLVGVGGIWLFPDSVPGMAAAAGTWWSLLALALVEWALFANDRGHAGRETLPNAPGAGADRRSHRESVWLLFGAAMLGCALAPLDTGNWECFHAVMVALAAAAGLRLWGGSTQLRLLAGGGWEETFEAASARASGGGGPIDHDLSCTHCGYNLRGLQPAGRCPECGQLIIAAMESAVGRLAPGWTGMLLAIRDQVLGVVLGCTAAATAFALRAAIDDPQGPWWSSGVLTALAVLVMVLALWAPRKALAYLGGVELCLATSIWWILLHWQTGIGLLDGDLSNLVHVNVIALAVAGLAWLFLERRGLWPHATTAAKPWWPPFHHAAAMVSVAVTALLAVAALGGTATGNAPDDWAPVVWLALAATGAILATCRLDPAFRWGSAYLYILGLTAVVRILAQSGMTPQTLTWALSLGLAGYVLATTVIGRVRVRRHGEAVAGPAIPVWLLNANGALMLISVLLAVLVAMTHEEIGTRMLVVASPLICAVAAVLLVPAVRGATMQTCAAALLSAAAVLFAWAWVPPNAPAVELHLAVGVVVAIVAVIVAAGVATFRIPREHAWATAIAHCVTGAGSAAGAALLFCSGSQTLQLLGGRESELMPAAVAAMIAALAVMIVCCVWFAVRDRCDPLHLGAKAKGAYIYLGEVLAALLALHVRATMPWLFSGIVAQYWPMLVMALAFGAAIVSEVFSRQGQQVLAKPLGRTAILLPFVAALELFILASRVHGSFVLLVAGGFYAVLAGLRRSVALTALAGLALTASLWYLLHHTPGLGITQHPQLWFIPPALAVLAAGHLNRAGLTAQQARLLHYGCLLAVYLSSTADVFLIGVANAPWLPLVLGGLSVAGIFVGIALRIRSFLMLGTGFLCLALFTMIWHAAANLGWTWVWYVAGIVLGVLIITVFALFERKRNEMNAWLGQMKTWRE